MDVWMCGRERACVFRKIIRVYGCHNIGADKNDIQRSRSLFDRVNHVCVCAKKKHAHTTKQKK